tara:strand:+ start:192 stop:584 length:393 start_codon:yes stop_codon:yes gene_type:complete
MAIVVKMPASELPVKVEDLNTENFTKKVMDIDVEEPKFLGKIPAVVDFHATWCGPCKVLSPVIDKLAEKYKDKIAFYKMNIEDEQKIAVELGIMSVPTLLFLPVDDKPAMMPGAPTEEQLEEIIKEKFKI